MYKIVLLISLIIGLILDKRVIMVLTEGNNMDLKKVSPLCTLEKDEKGSNKVG